MTLEETLYTIFIQSISRGQVDNKELEWATEKTQAALAQWNEAHRTKCKICESKDCGCF